MMVEIPVRILAKLCLSLVLCQALATGKPSDGKRISLTVPAAPWTLTLPGDNLVVERRQVKPDGRSGYFLLRGGEDNLTVSVFIEPAEQCRDSKSCRDMVWKLGNPAWENPQNVVQSEIGGVSFFEFFMPSFRGQAIRQQNMYAEFVVDGFWVDLHVSKVLYKPGEHEIFERLVKDAKFDPKKEAVKP
jgi:hypothetical protein